MKRKFNPVIIAIAIPLVAVAFAVGSVFYKKSATSGSDAFPTAAYIENPASFLGNRYMLKAQVESQLAYDANAGRLLCVKTPDGARVAVFVPIEIDKNIQAGQKYGFDVEVMPPNEGLKARGLEKY
ncbi:MAG: hypothetical protein J6T16_06435 [Opitutales bacterium]|nr:hypothetical protein [Opitutales bacterium]